MDFEAPPPTPSARKRLLAAGGDMEPPSTPSAKATRRQQPIEMAAKHMTDGKDAEAGRCDAAHASGSAAGGDVQASVIAAAGNPGCIN